VGEVGVLLSNQHADWPGAVLGQLGNCLRCARSWVRDAPGGFSSGYRNLQRGWCRRLLCDFRAK